MPMNKTKYLFFLILILFVGAGLRLTPLPDFPPALNWDEISHGYNAYSILKTGADEWGQKFPLINFRAYGDYPLPLNLYLTIPFVKLYGLNQNAIRLPHELLGILTILAVYFLTLGITRKRNWSLITALLVAIGPWYVFPSKFVLQSNLSVFLLITSLALFFNREKGKWLLSLSLFILFLSLFAYNSTRIVSPLILLGLIIFYKKEIRGIISWLIISVFAIALPFIFLNPGSGARSQWVFIIDQGAVNRIIELRQHSTLPPALTRLVYNRPVYFVKEFTLNYLGYFSPKYLFLDGGTQYQFSIPGWGLLAPVNLPFFYIGLVLLLIKALRDKNKNYKFILLWLVLAPIPASLTTEKFAVIRSTTMLPLVELISVGGLLWVLRKVRNNNFKIAVAVIYGVLLTAFTENYLLTLVNGYPAKYSEAWQYGYQQAVSYAKANYLKYDKIIITKKYGEPHEYVLFYWPWDPQSYRNDPNLIRYYQTGWYWVDRFDKFYFVNDWQVKDMKLESGGKIDCSNTKCLLITSPGNYPPGWKKLETINFLDGQPAFEIYEN